MDFAVPADHWGKLKESKKLNKYLDFAREQKKLWSIKVTVIPVVVRIFGPVSKNMDRGETVYQKNRGHPGHNTVKINKNTWSPEETCGHSDFCEEPR